MKKRHLRVPAIFMDKNVFFHHESFSISKDFHQMTSKNKDITLKIARSIARKERQWNTKSKIVSHSIDFTAHIENKPLPRMISEIEKSEEKQ